MGTQRLPGLWLPGVRVEVQDVRKAHRTPCDACGAMPVVGIRRLAVRVGSGRGARNYVLCEGCGGTFADRRAEEARALRRRLMGADVAVRLDPQVPGDPSYRPPAASCPFKKGDPVLVLSVPGHPPHRATFLRRSGAVWADVQFATSGNRANVALEDVRLPPRVRRAGVTRRQPNPRTPKGKPTRE